MHFFYNRCLYIHEPKHPLHNHHCLLALMLFQVGTSMSTRPSHFSVILHIVMENQHLKRKWVHDFCPLLHNWHTRQLDHPWCWNRSTIHTQSSLTSQSRNEQSIFRRCQNFQTSPLMGVVVGPIHVEIASYILEAYNFWKNMFVIRLSMP
jgi:hypothetical protein